MEWVEAFFDRAATWWGAPGVRASDHERASSLRAAAGDDARTVLHLGAGGGTTVVAEVAAGFEVTAVELAAVRMAHLRALVESEGCSSSVTAVEGSFYEVDVGGPFDAVSCWNGFGVGTDTDQRRLLRRVEREWLAPGAPFVLDVFAPWWWARDAGARTVEEHGGVRLVNERDFDPVSNRFRDAWWPEGSPEQRIEQGARCYAPADLALLLEGTGLEVASLHVDGAAFDAATPVDTSHPLWSSWEYRAVLVRAGD